MKIHTASDLKYAVEQSGQSPHFFTRETMRFFGDRMSNYGIRQAREIQTHGGPVLAYELLRKQPVKHGLQSSAFFDAATFSRVFPVKEGAADASASSATKIVQAEIKNLGHGLPSVGDNARAHCLAAIAKAKL